MKSNENNSLTIINYGKPPRREAKPIEMQWVKKELNLEQRPLFVRDETEYRKLRSEVNTKILSNNAVVEQQIVEIKILIINRSYVTSN